MSVPLSTVIAIGTFASKPAASIDGRIYFCTDTLQVFYDTGTAWVNQTPPGFANPMTTAGDLIVGGTSGAPGRLAPSTAGQVLTSNGVGVAPSFQNVPSAPISIGWRLNSGATGTNVGGTLAAVRAGTFTKCVLVVDASDGAVALGFRIKKNGTDIFSADPTSAAGTSAGTLTTFTSLTSSPLAVAANDKFTIDVTAGSSSWAITVQLE